MTTVNSAASASSAATVAAENIASTQKLLADTQERFLTLLITQLKNQDPLDPMDNAQITSQVAQLSTVTGINQLNQTLLALSGQLDVSQSMQAANLIGKDILVPGATVKVGTGEDGTHVTGFGMELLSPAAGVNVTILDATGKAVRTIEMQQPFAAGVHSLQWDGRDDTGVTVPDGRYTVVVNAYDASNAAVSAGSLTSGRVVSVAHSTNGVTLDLGLAGSVLLSDVRKIM